MRRVYVLISLAAVLAFGMGGLTAQPKIVQPQPKVIQVKQADWKSALAKRIPQYGHRNWIVIADSAYPSQSRAGIETVVTHADQLEVLGVVLDELAKQKHIRPVVYLDAELPHVPEKDAEGIDKYRTDLAKRLGDRQPLSLPHEQIIDKLDKAGEKFNVLLLKTNLTLPYTSVFLELDCGYWSPEAEKRLREAIGKNKDK